MEERQEDAGGWTDSHSRNLRTIAKANLTREIKTVAKLMGLPDHRHVRRPGRTLRRGRAPALDTSVNLTGTAVVRDMLR